MEEVSAVIALTSAIVAVATSLWGLWERQRRFGAQEKEWRRQSQRWLDDFDARKHELTLQAQRWMTDLKAERSREEVTLKKDFMLEQYRYRLKAYGAVIETLGAVSDVELRRSANGVEGLWRDRDRLMATAAALYYHLYGEAGLLMTMPTRNALHWARNECLALLDSKERLPIDQDISDAFFYARRYLRADLELLDDRSPENIQALVDRLNVETNAALPEQA
jgi:hypothetical protein